MDAGTRVFGILDEASCGGPQDCVGILAVDLDRPAADGGYLPIAIDGRTTWSTASDRRRGGAGRRRAIPSSGSPTPTTGPRPGHLPRRNAPGREPDAAHQVRQRVHRRHLPGHGPPVLGPRQWLDGSRLPLFGLLGVATISGIAGSTIPAQIFVFDAMTLRQINFTAARSRWSIAQKAVLSDGAQAIFDGGPTDIVIGQGVWPFSESHLRALRGDRRRRLRRAARRRAGQPAQGGIWPVSVNNRNAVEQYVRPDDIVVPVDSTNTECLYAFPILDNGVDGGVLWDEPGGPFIHTRPAALGPTLDDGGHPGASSTGESLTVATSCPPAYAYNIRSSGLSDGPLTVSGTRSGYLGRVSVPRCRNAHQLHGGGEHHSGLPALLAAQRRMPAPRPTDLSPVGFSFNLRDQNNPPASPRWSRSSPRATSPSSVGSGYQMDIRQRIRPRLGGHRPEHASTSPCCLPGSMALYQRQIYPLPLTATLGADRVFVLYPSVNTILDFSPTTVTYTTVNSADIGLHF